MPIKIREQGKPKVSIDKVFCGIDKGFLIKYSVV